MEHFDATDAIVFTEGHFSVRLTAADLAPAFAEICHRLLHNAPAGMRASIIVTMREYGDVAQRIAID